MSCPHKTLLSWTCGACTDRVRAVLGVCHNAPFSLAHLVRPLLFHTTYSRPSCALRSWCHLPLAFRRDQQPSRSNRRLCSILAHCNQDAVPDHRCCRPNPALRGGCSTLRCSTDKSPSRAWAPRSMLRHSMEAMQVQTPPSTKALASKTRRGGSCPCPL